MRRRRPAGKVETLLTSVESKDFVTTSSVKPKALVPCVLFVLSANCALAQLPAYINEFDKQQAQQQSNDIANTALVATQKGDTATLRSCIGNGANLDFQYDSKWKANGQTLLIVAVMFNRPECMTLLLNEGAKVDITDANGESALFYAATRNEAGAAKQLIGAHCDVNLQNKDGLTALHVAAQHNSLDVLKLLLEARPNLQLRSNTGLSAAEYAAIWGHTESFDLLEAAGTPYAPDLALAAGLGDVAEIEHQITTGAALNAVHKSGVTPIAAAARAGKTAAVKALLARGAKPDAPPGDPVPLILAIQSKHLDTARALLDARADPNVEDTGGNYPLRTAIEMGDLAAVSLLLDNGAKPNGVGQKWSAMHAAARSDRPDILKALVDRGADINTSIERGWTPLMVAASENKANATAFLLTHGARVGLKATVTDTSNLTGEKFETQMTALQMAERGQFETIQQIFLNPEAYNPQERPRDFSDSRKVTTEDWKQKYADFDPQRGRVATLLGFKQTFGEPKRIVDIEDTTFWYYQCADGWIELEFTNLKLTGGQLIIKGLNAVAEPKRDSAREESSTPQLDGVVPGGTALSSSTGAKTDESVATPAATSQQKSLVQQRSVSDPGVAGQSKLPSRSEWMAKIKRFNDLGLIDVPKEKLYEAIGPPTSIKTSSTGTVLSWDCSDGQMQIVAQPLPLEGADEIIAKIPKL